MSNKQRSQQGTTNRVDRIKADAIARFEERVKRNGDLSGFNKKLDIDMGLFNELYPGMVPRWMKDDGGRLNQAFGMGWDFVPFDSRIAVGDPVTSTGDTGDRISVIGGRDSNKAEGAYRLVLMMIPVEIHAKLVEGQQAVNNEKEAEINRLLKGGGSAPVAGSYTPESGAGEYVP